MKQRIEQPLRHSCSTLFLIKYVLLGLILFFGVFCFFFGSIPYSLTLDPHNYHSVVAEDGVDPFFSGTVIKHDDSAGTFDLLHLDSLLPQSIPVCFSSFLLNFHFQGWNSDFLRDLWYVIFRICACFWIYGAFFYRFPFSGRSFFNHVGSLKEF